MSNNEIKNMERKVEGILIKMKLGDTYTQGVLLCRSKDIASCSYDKYMQTLLNNTRHTKEQKRRLISLIETMDAEIRVLKEFQDNLAKFGDELCYWL